MTDANVQMAIETAKWHAAHNQRYVAIWAVVMSVSLFLAIVLWDHWWLAGVLVGFLNARDHQVRRNRELVRLHRLGVVRRVGSPESEFGRALKELTRYQK